MHELSLVLSMLELAEAAARREGASQIEVIHLDLGDLSGVVPEALDFAFASARQGTMAESARLEVHRIPAVAYCEDCQQSFELDNRYGIALCPSCDALCSGLQQGFEMNLRQLEVI